MIEILGKNPTGKLYYGNALIVSRNWLKEYSQNVDLIYIDPPEISGNSFRVTRKVGINQGRIVQSGGIDTHENKNEYLKFLEEIIINSRDMLKNTGNIFVHTGSKMSAHIKIILDRIFGESNFRNEIIYTYEHGGPSNHSLRVNHDTILFYSKSSKGYFKPVSTGEVRGSKRRNHMKKNISPDGRVFYSINISGKQYKYYEDDIIYAGDVWSDIDSSCENDRYRYDCQKPEQLIERIFECGSPENSLICDPFCGSGIAGAVAAKTGRLFLLCDNSPIAVHLAKTNIAQTKKSFQVIWKDGLNIYNSLPKARFQKDFSQEKNKVTLEDYRVEGADEYYSNTLLPTEDTVIDFWSVGRLIEDNYYVDDFDMRTHEKPNLGKSLYIKNDEGKKYAFTSDVFGNQVLHEL